MEKISALMDGELDARQSEQQYARLNQDTDARTCWSTYHLIGDVLRGDAIVSKDFNAKLRARLEQEPTVLAPQPPRARPAKRITTYALSAAASLSAVALVGWMAFNNPLTPDSVSTASSSGPAPAVSPVSTSPTVPVTTTVVADTVEPQLASVPRDDTMNEYLMAHQEFSPSTAIQGVAPYIRSVSAAK
jgi:sigma-E factor negative regulatory protein RseA